MVSFNKVSNTLRRLDEAEPSNTLMRPAEVVHGGFSAQMARLRRGAKSRRKAAARLHSSRHVRLG
jgi:hypothetical protein